MKAGRPSVTAEGVAAIRAAEMTARPAGRRVLEDPVAGRLLAGRRKWILRAGPLLRALLALNSRCYPGMVWEVLARGRYARERILALEAGGNRQVVILGAGFDTTAWWSGLPSGTRVFEIDDPATQALKRRRLAAAGIVEPEHLRFVAQDLGRGGLREGLSSAGHDARSTSLFTALGVLPYLDRPAVERLFEEMGGCLEGGGESVYTFPSPRLLDPSRWPAGARRIARRLARAGEPLLFGAEPDEMAALARSAGFEQEEVMDGDDMTSRYFAPAGDRRAIEPGLYMARAAR